MTVRTSRRRMLVWLIGGVSAVWAAAVATLSGAFLSSALRNVGKRDETRIGALDLFDDTFRQVRIEIPIDDGWYKRVQRQVLYVRAASEEEEEPVVLSATCSHLGCTVNWDDATGEFACPCHGGRFDADGQVSEGPPPDGLKRFQASVRDGYVYARLDQS